MRKQMLIISACLMAAALAGCKRSAADTKEVVDFTSIVDNNGADPWIYQDEMYYYYTKTTGNSLTLWRSENLTDAAAGEEKVVWEMPVDFESIWAPELHRLDEEWYIYFAANHPAETHRMYALVNENDDPFEGDWQLAEIEGMDDKFAIDGTVLELGGKRYFIWSGWEGYENIAQNLYIAEMRSPTEVIGKKKLISEPEYEWEIRQTPLINEGPQVIIRENTVNLVYSASGSWDNDYALGLLTMEIDLDPLDPQNWHKEGEPIFQQTDTVFGPGTTGLLNQKTASKIG